MCDKCVALSKGMGGGLFNCADCGNDTSPTTGIAEYYMVSSSLWHDAVNGRPASILCIGCLEKRIGRKLKAYDFGGNGSFPVNSIYEHSPRLRNRLGWREGMHDDMQLIIADDLARGFITEEGIKS